MNTSIVIETPRLILRTVTMEDIDDVALNMELYSGAISHEEAEKEVMWMQENHRQNAPGKIIHLCLAMIDKDSQTIIGWCGLDHRDTAWPNPVLFYLLKETYWGRGLATEAAKGLLGYAFSDLRLPRVDSGCAFENIASKRVMEKIGMRYLGFDETGGHSFTLTRGEWMTKKAA